MVQLFKEWDGKPAHKYHDEFREWIKWHSVSKVKTHCSSIDREAMAMYAANNVTHKFFGWEIEKIFAEWEKGRMKGANDGTSVHKILELYHTDDTYEPGNSFEEEVIDAFKLIEPKLGLGRDEVEGYYCERIVSVEILSEETGITARDIKQADLLQLATQLSVHPNCGHTREELMAMERKDLIQMAIDLLLDVGMAGTVDIIVDITGNFFDIIDIKTDKKINRKSYYKKGTRQRQYMKAPLQNIMQCNYREYCIQVCLYAMMYANETGRKFRKGTILWFDSWDNDLKMRKEDKEFKLIPVDRMFKTSAKLLNHYFGITKNA